MSTWVDFVTEAVEGGGRDQAIRYLTTQRWFGAKGRRLSDIRVIDRATLADTPDAPLLTILGVEFADGPPERYFLPLIIRPKTSTGPHETQIVTVQTPEQSASAWEITADPAACMALFEGIRHGDRWQGAGVFTCTQTPALASLGSRSFANVKAIGAEQSNTSLIYDSRVILKLIRKLEAGINPDGEILEFLTTKTSYRYVPELLGQIRYDGSDGPASGSAYSATVAILTTFIPNEGDGWAMTLRHLGGLAVDTRSHGNAKPRSQVVAHVQAYSGDFLSRMRRLGEITAGLHVALASDSSDVAFRPEPITQADVTKWQTALRGEIHMVMQQVCAMPARVLEPLSLNRERLDTLETRCVDMTTDALLLTTHRVMKIRIHGDYHLGQVLDTNADFIILDFEGEPARTLEERRSKACPLKDVAGMLRSFNYAKHVTLRQSKSSSDADRTLLEVWEQETVDAFVAGYHTVAKLGDVVFLPDSPAAAGRLLALFQLEKAVYELRYEINNRPDWIEIPIQGLQRLLGQ